MDIRKDWLTWRQAASVEEVYSLSPGTIVRAHIYHHFDQGGASGAPAFDKVEAIEFSTRADGEVEVTTPHADVFFTREDWRLDKDRKVGRFGYGDVDSEDWDELVIFLVEEDLDALIARQAKALAAFHVYAECAERGRAYASAVTRAKRNAPPQRLTFTHGDTLWTEAQRWSQEQERVMEEATLLGVLITGVQEGSLTWREVPVKLCEEWEKAQARKSAGGSRR